MGPVTVFWGGKRSCISTGEQASSVVTLRSVVNFSVLLVFCQPFKRYGRVIGSLMLGCSLFIAFLWAINSAISICYLDGPHVHLSGYIIDTTISDHQEALAVV